jgi:hypothetical protein
MNMRFMKSNIVMSTVLNFAPSAFAVLAFAAAAQAGTITSASGPIQINGKDVTVAPGKTVALKAGDTFSTQAAKVAYRSETGDDVTFDPGSIVREEEVNSAGAAVFMLKGSASGTLSDRTLLGVAAGWVNAPQKAKAKVTVDATPGRENSGASFRAVDGAATIRYRSYTMYLMQAHSVTLDIDPAAPGNLAFRTGQQNAGDVEIHKSAGNGGDMVVSVPKATLGAFTDEAGNKTKICDDINSLKTAKMKLESRFAKGTNTASIGPGTCALIDNATGAIQVLFTAVKFEILERAISLTTEFSTLAQSNFSDVK